MASSKIDFYLEVFKQTKFWVISQEQQSTKTLEFTEKNPAIFIASLKEKKCLAVHLTGG